MANTVSTAISIEEIFKKPTEEDLYNEVVEKDAEADSVLDGHETEEPIQPSPLYYSGIPREGSYEGRVTVFQWLADVFESMLDWLLGFLTLGVRIQIVGWSALIEVFTTDLINDITGTEDATENVEQQHKMQETNAQLNNSEEDDRITIERIIYNDVPILDANLLNFEEAAGLPLSENSILYKIRLGVATWYYGFRNVAIIGLLLVLIYLGIRMAISTIAEEKAKYKKMLSAWAVSFLLVFVIHYIIVIVMQINETLVNIMVSSSGGQEVSLYNAVRNSAYDLRGSVGWMGAIVYAMLVYYMIRFLFLYFKRLLTIAILIAIAPLLAISAAMEKIKSNKSKSLGIWMKELIFNVLIQSIHALIYTIFLSTILAMMTDLTIANVVPKLVLAAVILNFMIKAEKYMKLIFNIKANSLKDVMESTAGVVMSAKTIGHAAKSVGSVAVKPLKPIGNALIEKDKNRYKQARLQEIYGGDEELAKARITTNIDEKLDKVLDEEYDQKVNAWRNTLKTSTKGAKAMITGIASVPLTFINPKVGVTGLMKSRRFVASSKLGVKNTPKGRYLEKKRRSGKKHKIVGAIGSWATLGISRQAGRLIDATKEEKFKANKKSKKKLNALVDLKRKEKAVIEETERLKESGHILFKPIMEDSSELEIELKRKYEETFEQNVKEVMQLAPTANLKDVKKAVSNYLLKSEGNVVQVKDADAIARELNVQFKAENKADVKVTKQFKTNFQKVLESKNLKEEDLKKMDLDKLTDLVGETLTKNGSIQRKDVPRDLRPLMEKIGELRIANAKVRKAQSSLAYRSVPTLVEKIKQGVEEGSITAQNEAQDKQT